MRKVISRKMYDTETAECVGEDGYGAEIFTGYWVERLYQKKNGEFFLYGEGGCKSKYGRHEPGIGYIEGRTIIPLSVEEAKDWTEQHLEADDYIALFGELEE